MPTRSRDLVLLLAAALTLTACSAGVESAGCRSDGECPAASRCRDASCVGDATPIAAIRPLAPVEEFALVELDGTDSRDDDDDVLQHLWTIRSVTASCEPPQVASADPIARVRFGCPGRYEVSLSVRDALGVDSAPVAIEVVAVPSNGARVVFSGPDVATDHSCSGAPLLCRPVDAVDLSASTTVPGLELRWSVEPPLERPLDAGRRVGFSPGPGSAAPTASIETDGSAIAGDWIFRVEARDEFGVLGAAYTRVSVRNRAPIVVADLPAPFPHAFDAAGSRFTSSGEIAWGVVDPDGDPIEIAATWRHVGDGGAPFSGELAPGSATFAVEVPYAAPADALLLRGGEGLARTIEIVARDSNRAAGSAVVPIDIGNRPPQPVGGLVTTRVPHTFDTGRSRYVANVQLGTWVDPDGDPLFGGTGVTPCDAVSVLDGNASVECSVPFDGVPAVERLAGHRSVSVPVRDPWDVTATVPTYGIDILNSLPTLALGNSLGTICIGIRINALFGTYCPVPATEYTVIPIATDPDGDPVLVRAVPFSAVFPFPGAAAIPERVVCTTPECLPIRFIQPATRAACTTYYSMPRNYLAASDGMEEYVVAASPTPLWPTPLGGVSPSCATGG
jgi:hypothetical protein